MIRKVVAWAVIGMACLRGQAVPGMPDFVAYHTGYLAQPYVIGDMDGDGTVDLVSFMSNAASGTHIVFVQHSLLRDGLGGPVRFVPAPQMAGTLCYPSGGDIDNNGTIDIFGRVMTWGPGPWSGLARPDELWLCDAAGNLTQTTGRLPTQPTAVMDMAFIDVDGDGDLDMFLAGPVPGNLLYLNDGRGFFTDVTAARLPIGTSLTPSVVAALDFDGDGDQDVLVGYESGTPALYVNDGRGFFTLGTVGTQVGTPIHAAVGDLDGDGRLEVILACSNRGPDVLAWVSGTTLAAVPWAMPGWFDAGVKKAFLVDMDADGDLDLVVGRNGTNYPLIAWAENRGGGVFVDVPTNLPQSVGGEFMGVFDYDQDGDPDISTRYGLTGIFLANTQRQLLPRNDPLLGNGYRVSAFGMAGHVFVHGISLGAVGTRLPELGWLWLDPAQFAVFGLGVYQVREEQTLTLPVPPRPSLVGFDVCLQALDLDTVRGTARLTNCPCRTIR